MKHLTILLMSCLLLLFAGCGGDDGGGTTPTPATRVVAAHPASAPSLDSVDDPVWDAINATTVNLDQDAVMKQAVGKVQVVPSSISMKAATINDSLYLRIVWTDSDNDVLRDRYLVTAVTPNVTIDHDPDDSTGGFAEDQVVVMFAGLDGGAFDVLVWRSLTTAPAFLAEGMTWDSTNGLVEDYSGQKAYYENPELGGSSAPTYIHESGNAFTGSVLYTNESIEALGFMDWTLGQIIPGWRIDSSVVHRDASYRQSRWDTQTISEYDDGANQYTVVMCRPLNTGYAEDLNMAVLDSVRVKVGVTDNQMSLTSTGSNLGFSGLFWMVF